MHIDGFIARLEKLAAEKDSFSYSTGAKLSREEIRLIATDLGVVFPEKLITFYEVVNGLTTVAPDFTIIDIRTLSLDGHFLPLATFDHKHQVGFLVDKRNDADEWNIVAKESHYQLTKTISSFWSNKIWHWLEKERVIWADRYWEH